MWKISLENPPESREKKSEMANLKVQSRVSNILILGISERKDRVERWKHNKISWTLISALIKATDFSAH